jgi:DNA-binding HxlR family transcriptional regulator
MIETKCPYCLLKYINGKWKMDILISLKDGKLRMSELEYRIPKANPRVLVRQLRCLEKDGIVSRKIYAEIPQKVEYSITEFGKDIVKLLSPCSETA